MRAFHGWCSILALSHGYKEMVVSVATRIGMLWGWAVGSCLLPTLDRFFHDRLCIRGDKYLEKKDGMTMPFTVTITQNKNKELLLCVLRRTPIIGFEVVRFQILLSWSNLGLESDFYFFPALFVRVLFTTKWSLYYQYNTGSTFNPVFLNPLFQLTPWEIILILSIAVSKVDNVPSLASLTTNECYSKVAVFFS